MFVRLYWILPLFSALCWLAMLITMLTWWVYHGKPHYVSMEPTQHIAYLSDVGAAHLYGFWIPIAATSLLSLVASMIAERWLRHNGRLALNTSFNQKWLDVAAILCAIGGAIGFILLTIFNTRDYPKMHDRCLGVFLAFYVASAIFICAEYGLLGRKFRSHPILWASFCVKLFFLVVEIILAIAFGVLQLYSDWNAAACLEWALCFTFTFYILTFVLDLLPAVRTKHHMGHATVAEVGGEMGYSGYGGSTGYTNGTHHNGQTNGNSAYPPPTSTNY